MISLNILLAEYRPLNGSSYIELPQFIINKKDDDDEVRDHCQFTGKYRGASEYICNPQFNMPTVTPVIFR